MAFQGIYSDIQSGSCFSFRASNAQTNETQNVDINETASKRTLRFWTGARWSELRGYMHAGIPKLQRGHR